MADADRRELVRNAVSFLSDFTTQQAPIAQRVQFLEAKGLTGPEIEEAMKQAASQPRQNYFQSPYPTYGPYPSYPSQQWDWRDYFVRRLTLPFVARKYLQPHLIPPAATAYEQDRDGLTAQFDAAEALLKEIQAETEAVKSAVYEQNERVDKVTKDVESVVVEMREGESKTRDEMREIRDEVENIREMLPKMIEKNKETQKESLSELQQELKSLKALLLSRGSAALTSSPSTPIPSLAGRPSIPSWQLSSPAPVPSAAESLPSSTSLNGFFRQAVEGFAQPQPRRSQDFNGDENRFTNGPPDTQSARQLQSTNQLADAALNNTRKSFASQRPGSPLSRSSSPVSSSIPKSNSAPDPGLRKFTLEERLRASFSVGEASNTTSPAISSRASPTPNAVLVTQHPLSPTLIPLPASPVILPAAASPPHISDTKPSDIPADPSPFSLAADHLQDASEEGSHATSSSEVPQALADVPLPSSPEETLAIENPTSLKIPADVEALQGRLRLVEQQFSDVSTSFKKLQAERSAVDDVIRELTPLEDSDDATVLRDYLSNMNMKTELDQIDKLRQQLTEAEALVAASQASASHTEEETARRNAEIERLGVEEEEKRVKAISLLKTVRQKLSEIDAVNADREKAVTGLRTQFDREVAAIKDRSEKELSAARAQFEAEIAALKMSHSTESTLKRSQITTLEASVNNLSRENRSSFEQLQIRQAELESSQHHVGTLQSQHTELQFQLREAQDRLTLLTEEISDLRGEQETRPHGPRLAEFKRNLVLAEKERTESEADWSRKLCEKGRETDELKTILQSSAKLREEKDSTTGVLKDEIEKLTVEVQNHQRHALELQLQVDRMNDAELRISDAKAEAEGYKSQLESLKAHEAQLRSHIKYSQTLREELRKVQNSAALLERQRNPGVGYWTSRNENTDSRTSISSGSDLPSRAASPGPTSPTPSKGDEDINLEYLRNVILQFLEHKEMRPNLVRVLSIILRFTPQETRRLIAKVQ
ncbi:hypothetical protein EDB19DRAFT_1891247 [Suillus lakei]|nr:hypothetical protein EDB19DRAFT_1891247 [Suillus lakei]